eukprot:998774_1
MKYKYQIVLDGTSSRDAFARQMRYETLILKQLSKSKEFWHYDLINNSNVVLWSDVNELIDIVGNIGARVDNGEDSDLIRIVRNRGKYVSTHFNSESVHCFMLKMLDVYNTYFYDAHSTQINNKTDIEIISLDWLIHDFFDCKQYDNEDIIQNQHAICTLFHPYKEPKIIQ